MIIVVETFEEATTAAAKQRTSKNALVAAGVLFVSCLLSLLAAAGWYHC
jgi:hypothetical protein